MVTLQFNSNAVYTLKSKGIKVLIVCSGNFEDPYHNFQLQQSFVYEQMESLKKLNVEFDIFLIRGKGILGYLKNIVDYHKKILNSKPDLIHAHFGLSGFFANLQFQKPVVTTFHGSDVQLSKKNLIVSKVASFLSKFSILVNEKMVRMLNLKDNYEVIPCGIDFFKIESTKPEARDFFGFNHNERLVLFASSFDNTVKNYPLAKSAIDLLENTRLIELKGYKRREVMLLLQAVDCLLMTSFTEGSPQVIKEALMMGCPIVSTDVGDVKEVLEDVDGCYLVESNPIEIAKAIEIVLKEKKNVFGIKKLQEMNLFNDQVSQNIFRIYQHVIKV